MKAGCFAFVLLLNRDPDEFTEAEEVLYNAHYDECAKCAALVEERAKRWVKKLKEAYPELDWSLRPHGHLN